MTNQPLGLTSAEVIKKRAEFGLNQISDQQKLKWQKILLHQFTSPLVYILLVAVGLTMILREFSDAIIIALVIILNGIFGFIQENKANQTALALKSLIKSTAKVWRDGKIVVVDAVELVPDDVVLVEAGDMIPADGIILTENKLIVSEAQLTGETYPLHKKNEELVFQSSPVQTGTATIRVTATGSETKVGQISRVTLAHQQEQTPLERDISGLSKKLLMGAVISLILMLILSWRNDNDWLTTVKLSLSLAVSVVPESLPIILTLTLALGAQRMSKARALMKNLSSTSSLAGVDVIATDKTGTLTMGSLILRDIITLAEIENEVDLVDREKVAGEWQMPAAITSTLQWAVLGTEATYDPPQTESGDPLDLAILKAAESQGLPWRKWWADAVVRARQPFDSEVKFSAAIMSLEGMNYVVMKGAPEAVLPYCLFREENDLKQIENYIEELNQRGLRTIVVAKKKLDPEQEIEAEKQTEGISTTLLRDLDFECILEFTDPLRPEIKESVAQIQAGGVKIIMITGDHLTTAKYIATQAGIFNVERGDVAFLGEEIEKILIETQEQKGLPRELKNLAVIARATPQTKMLILERYQQDGHIVAMTGDGVNDAPALAAADIGVAMGVAGTQVAKESADMILTDDNFATLVVGISEARQVFDNLRKVLVFLISTSLLEVVFILLATWWRLPAPVTAVQILWLNLVTDSFSTLALAIEPQEKDLANLTARDYQGKILLREHVTQIAFLGVMMAGIATLIYFICLMKLPWLKENLAVLQTIMLTTLAALQWFNTFNCRSSRSSVFRVGFFTNPKIFLFLAVAVILQFLIIYIPFFQPWLGTANISGQVWLLIISGGVTLVVAEESRKLITRRLKRPIV